MGTASFANPVHATRHSSAGDDPVTPDSIGAATAAQGAKADSAVQPGSLATVATTGAYGDLSGKPTLGTAASHDVSFFATPSQALLQVTGISGNGTTDNYTAIQAALNACPFGGTVRVSTPTSVGNKVALSQCLVIPSGVTLECDNRSTKLNTDEATGVVFVPHSTYTPTVVATDSVGGTVASGSNGTYRITRTTGSWDTNQFKQGQIISLVGAAGGATLPTNCQIFSLSGSTMTVTGGTGATAGTCTGLTGTWGSLLALTGDHCQLRRVSADASTTVPRAAISSGLRNTIDTCDFHGGTLASLDLPPYPGVTSQVLVINTNTENQANRGGTYARQYGPYSMRCGQGDAQIIGGRFIYGTKAFMRGASGTQLIGPHFTGATNSGPNVELGDQVLGHNVMIDSADAIGTCLVQHLTATENYGFNPGNSILTGVGIFADNTVHIPILIEDSTISSVTFRNVIVYVTGSKLSLLASFTNGSNPDTAFDDVLIGNSSMVNIGPFTLWSGGLPGRALNIRYNNGTTTSSLDGNGTYVPATTTVAITAGADNDLLTTNAPFLYEGTYRAGLRALGSGATSASTCDAFLTAGTATMTGMVSGSTTTATSSNPFTVSGEGTFQVTAAGTVTLTLHPNTGITGTIVANKNSLNQGKAGATALVLTKIA